MIPFTTEFKALDEMTPAELERERTQSWSIVKSDTSVWIHRNSVPYMPVPSRLIRDAQALLDKYGLTCSDIDERQVTWSQERWRRDWRDAQDAFAGRIWKLRFRRFRRWIGLEA